jgi:phosphotransferase system enzyme I (PtsP)
VYKRQLLGALQELAQDAKRLDKPISLCGELAGDPAGALLLMAMGFTSLSMNAPSLPKVRAAIRRVTLADAQALLDEIMQLDTPVRVHEHLNKRLDEWQLSHLLPPRD